jgi:hypothetical protein
VPTINLYVDDWLQKRIHGTVKLKRVILRPLKWGFALIDVRVASVRENCAPPIALLIFTNGSKALQKKSAKRTSESSKQQFTAGKELFSVN